MKNILKAALLIIQITILCVVGVESAMAQGNIIKGVIIDEEKQPVIGATIVIQGTQIGTVTNYQGEFNLNFKGKNPMLQISSMGFQSLLVKATKGKAMNITLQTDVTKMEDIVVVGYGEARRSDITGALSSLKVGSEAEESPLVSADQLLQGRVAGVNISSNSGAPGDAMNIQIRGVSTLSGDTSPLYVVDGFPMEMASPVAGSSQNELNQQSSINPLASINPNDIEYIQVLKDASATAIYGSRATNGVIIITTKQGKAGDVRVNYNGRIDVSSVSKMIPMLNGYNYGLYENELDRTSQGFDMNGEVIINEDTRDPRNTPDELEIFKKYSTDWQDLIYNTAISQDHQFSLSGGSPNIQYNVAVGYTDQNGVILNTGLNRFSIRTNLTAKLTKRLKFVTASNYTQIMQHQTSCGQESSTNQMVRRILGIKPTMMPGDIAYEEDLDYVAVDNPYTMVSELKDIMDQKVLNLNGSLIYDAGHGITLKTAANLNNNIGDRSSYYPIETNMGASYGGAAFRGVNSRQNVVWENTINYVKNISRSDRLNAVLGFTHEDRSFKTTSIFTGGYAGNELGFNNNGTAANTINKSGSLVHTKMSSLLGRINYSMLDRYVFTVTGRYDGSSILAEGHRWSFFPSAAFAWRINNESFLKEVEQLSNLKMRLSYGVTGNQNIGFAAPYSTMNYDRVNFDDNIDHAYIASKLGNDDLGWESTTSYNVGFDIGVVKNRYRLSVDAYKRTTEDILMNFGIPTSSGYGTLAMNVGSMDNYGMEIEAGADILTGPVKLSVGGNIYFNRNTMVDLNNTSMMGAVYLAGGNTLNQAIHITREGATVGSFFGYVVDGVYQNREEAEAAPFDTPQATPGSLKYVDISGPSGVPDGQITTDDMTIIGNAQPLFNYGINADLSYKNISLSMLFTGRYGGQIANLNRYFSDSFSNFDNVSVAAWEGRWTGEGTSNYYPAVDGSKSATMLNKRFSTYLLEDGSYLRLNNVTLSYLFNMKRSKAIRSLKVFASASNVFTISDYSGYDPDVSITPSPMSPNVDFAAYPATRTFSVGVNLGF